VVVKNGPGPGCWAKSLGGKPRGLQRPLNTNMCTCDLNVQQRACDINLNKFEFNAPCYFQTRSKCLWKTTCPTLTSTRSELLATANHTTRRLVRSTVSRWACSR
jgi:hypothetical protein